MFNFLKVIIIETIIRLIRMCLEALVSSNQAAHVDGQAAVVTALLATGSNVNVNDNHGDTALMVAAQIPRCGS